MLDSNLRYGGFLKYGYPKIIHFNCMFHSKLSISGAPIYGTPHMWLGYDSTGSNFLEAEFGPVPLVPQISHWAQYLEWPKLPVTNIIHYHGYYCCYCWFYSYYCYDSIYIYMLHEYNKFKMFFQILEWIQLNVHQNFWMMGLNLAAMPPALWGPWQKIVAITIPVGRVSTSHMADKGLLGDWAHPRNRKYLVRHIRIDIYIYMYICMYIYIYVYPSCN